MSLLQRLFPPRPSAASRAGAELSRHRIAADRALIRKTAREMRERLGMPPSDALRDR